MKKLLLIASLAIAGIAPALAVTDGATYETKNGITCTNLWINDLKHNKAGWEALPFNGSNYARTACIATVNGQDFAVVSYMPSVIVGENSTYDAELVFIDLASGKLAKSLQLTYNGEPIRGLLCINQVGFDQFGHIWVANYVSTVYNPSTEAYGTINLYVLDDFQTGACSLAAQLQVLEDDAAYAANARIDYYSLVGDVTRQEASCTVMAAFAENTSADPKYESTGAIAWRAEQGSDEWEGAFDGGFNVMDKYLETYPAEQTKWGTAPMVRILLNDEYSNELYYIDGFTTCPTLYNTAGGMSDSFESAPSLAPLVGTNGVGEFALGEKNFIAYSLAQYQDFREFPPCGIAVAEMGEGPSFEGMQEYWQLPEGGMGETSDGGARYHAVETKVYTDDNGNQGAYLLTYKCRNGIGVYAIGEENWEAPEGSVGNIVADGSNAPVEYFNLMGVRVDNPAAGQLIIKKQGENVTKEIVR